MSSLPLLEEEVGRELTADDLKPRTVVWVLAPGKIDYYSAWVIEIDPAYVLFFLGQMRLHVICRRRPGDASIIVDDQDRVVRVFEYLGEV